MKKSFLTTLFLLCQAWLYAQTVTGKVYREGSETAIPSATVYYGGSMTGTITDNDGRFTLQKKAEQVPITVSCIGYYSASVHYQPNRPLMVYLKPKQEELHDVVIRADGMSRKDEMELFIHEFLGLSSYARNCTIGNMDDVDLFYNKTTRVLSATCDKPIIINNKMLGYTISYYLDKFIKTPKQTYFAGDYIFKESAFINDRDRAKIMRNRENAYEGSRMQLIRTLWNNTLKASDFVLYTPDYTPLKASDIVMKDSANNKYLRLGGRVRIIYNGDTRALNTVNCLEELSYIDSSGFYNAGLRWAGEMGQQRVGDLLPFDYQSTNKLKNIKTTVAYTPPANKENKKKGPVNKQLELFKTIVLVKDNPLDNQPVIRKWDQPVYYKIYGTCGNKEKDQLLADLAKSVFKHVADNSSLKITSVTDDKAVNFFIILNRDADSYNNYKQILPADAVRYFTAHQQSPGYYSYNENGFTAMVKLVDLKGIVDQKKMNDLETKFPIVVSMLKQHILNGLGFFNLASPYKGSAFHNDVITESDPQTKVSDVNIIGSLYRADVKSGMTEQELDNRLSEQTP